MISIEKYLADPCGVSSLPYWKTVAMAIPEDMKILHQDERIGFEFHNYQDEAYFRLLHDLRDLSRPTLPQGFSVIRPSLKAFAAHINSCYNGIGITERELLGYTKRPVYDGSLWLAVKEDRTGEMAATGIAELDRDLGEGVLEWIQVSEGCRRRGLGSYVVSELLYRMKNKASFVTVSGQCGSASDPEGLYRKCGFTGGDVWHILRKQV